MIGDRVRRLRQRLTETISWSPPTSTQIGVLLKSGLAAGVAWSIASVATGVSGPALAPLTALVVVQVSVRASVRTTLQRSAAVVLGVLVALGLALALGDALELNGLTVGVLVAVSLGIAELVLQLPPTAARQVPVSVLVVLTAVAGGPVTSGWQRAQGTLIGAAVGVVVSLLLPASRLLDARQSLDRLADSLGGVLESMGAGLEQPWSTEQTEEWRRRARAARDRAVHQTSEAVSNGREATRWNARDRRHVDVLGRYEDVQPRLERSAIGVSVIARGLDDHARLGGTTHQAMPAMGALLVALAGVVRALVHDVLDEPEQGDLPAALDEVRVRRARCAEGAYRRARLALGHDDSVDGEGLEGEWLNYAALLVQVDRIVGDLSSPLPA